MDILQVTLPKGIIIKLGLSEGDKLDIFEKDGSICIMPVAVYPKKYLDELQQEIGEIKANLETVLTDKHPRTCYIQQPGDFCLLTPPLPHGAS